MKAVVTRLIVLSASFLIVSLASAADGDWRSDFLENYYAGVTRVTLPNGLDLIIKEKHTAPIVSVQAWFRAGSIYEGERLGSGLSHFLEHMLFDGTDEVKDKNGSVLFQAWERNEITRLARDLGGRVNAYTSQDRTVFHCTVAAESARDAIRMIGHQVMHASLKEDILSEEINAVLNEASRNLDNPAFVLRQRIFEKVYRIHPARVPVIGYIDHLKNLKRQDLMDYYKTRYVPNNMALVVAGDVGADDVIAWAYETFIGPDPDAPLFERGILPHVAMPPEPPRNTQTIELFENEQVEFISGEFSFPTVGIHHPDLYALDILADILGRGKASVLHRKLIIEEPESSVEAVSAGHYTPFYKGRFYIKFRLRPDVGFSDFRDRLLAEMELFRTDKIDSELIAKSADRIGERIVLSLSKVDKIGRHLGKTWLNRLHPEFDLHYLQNLRKVTPGDVMRAAGQYLDPVSMIQVAMGPEGFLKKALSEEKKILPPVVEEPALHELSNGIPVVVSRNEESPVAVLAAMGAGGVRLENEINNGSFGMIASLAKCGTEKYSQEELDDIQREKGISIESGADKDIFFTTVKTMKNDWKLGCELLHELLCRPLYPADELDRRRKTTVLSLRQAGKNPRSRAFRELEKEIHGSHPYSMNPAGTEASLNNITPESLELLGHSFVVPENIVISVVGAVDPETALSELERLFGSMQGRLAVPDVPASQPLTEKRDKVIALPGIHQTSCLLGFAGLSRNDPDMTALPLITAILSERLKENLRKRRGLVYYTSARFTAGFDRGLFWLQADTKDAGRVREILKGYFDEIHILKNDLVEPSLLENAGRVLLSQEASRHEEVMAIAIDLAFYELYGKGFDYIRRKHDMIQSVTPADVRRVARRIFTEEACCTVTVKPK